MTETHMNRLLSSLQNWAKWLRLRDCSKSSIIRAAVLSGSSKRASTLSPFQSLRGSWHPLGHEPFPSSDPAMMTESFSKHIPLTLRQEEMATHSSIRAWKIPWTEVPGGLQFRGSQRVRHKWATGQECSWERPRGTEWLTKRNGWILHPKYHPC